MFNMVYQKISSHPIKPVHFSFKTKTKKTLCISVKAQSSLPFAGVKACERLRL